MEAKREVDCNQRKSFRKSKAQIQSNNSPKEVQRASEIWFRSITRQKRVTKTKCASTRGTLRKGCFR